MESNNKLLLQVVLKEIKIYDHIVITFISLVVMAILVPLVTLAKLGLSIIFASVTIFWFLAMITAIAIITSMMIESFYSRHGVTIYEPSYYLPYLFYKIYVIETDSEWTTMNVFHNVERYNETYNTGFIMPMWPCGCEDKYIPILYKNDNALIEFKLGYSA